MNDGTTLRVTFRRVAPNGLPSRHPGCLHDSPRGASLRPVIIERCVSAGRTYERDLPIDLPPYRRCCAENPVVRVMWWDSIYRTLERATGVGSMFIVKEIEKTVPALTEEEVVASQYFAQSMAESAEAPGKKRSRKEHFSEAMLAAESLFRAGESSWRTANQAWWQAGNEAVARNWVAFDAMVEAAFRWADVAVAKEKSSAHCRLEKIAEWTVKVGVWTEARARIVAKREAKAAKARARSASRNRGASPASPSRTSATATPPARVSAVDRVRRASLQECARILDVAYPFTSEQLKRALRVAALKHHPDRGGDQEQMLLVNLAYGKLNDSLMTASCSSRSSC